jgi:hypothetical protein
VTKTDILIAKLEAQRFLAKVRAWEKTGMEAETFLPCKERAAMRRASLDLTRALAEMRK